jgi:hypothetical protein
VTKSKPHHWYGWPRRDEVRATDLPPRPQRGRKNTRRWCRGKVGVPHQVEVRVSRHAYNDPPCYRVEWYTGCWFCNHERACTVCGKVIDITLGDDCPLFTTEVTRTRRKRE